MTLEIFIYSIELWQLMLREEEEYCDTVTEKKKMIKLREKRNLGGWDKLAIPRMREIIYSAGLFKHSLSASKS